MRVTALMNLQLLLGPVLLKAERKSKKDALDSLDGILSGVGVSRISPLTREAVTWIEKNQAVIRAIIGEVSKRDKKKRSDWGMVLIVKKWRASLNAQAIPHREAA